MSKKTLGQLIHQLREKKGIGLRELGRMVDVTAISIANIENDRVKKPSPRLLKRISTALNYPSDILFAKARMVDPDVEKVIIKRPTIVPDFLRAATKLSIEQWTELKNQAKKIQRGIITSKPRPPSDVPKVLVVENDPFQTAYLITVLSKLGISAIAISSAEEALSIMKSINVDCMLLDIHLGAGISGLSLMEEFRQQERYTDLPIIAITAYYGGGMKKELLEKGFTDYMQKPYKSNQLKEMLTQYGIA